MTANCTNISPDGRYIATKYGAMGLDGNASPALVDTETGKYSTFDPVSSGTAMTVGPDGTVFGATPASGVSQGWVFDFDNSTSVTLEDWLQQEYGIFISGGRMVSQVSTDGNVLFGSRPSSGAM